MKILVAMSGGVDSSVVAHVLAEQGHELIGVRFTLWTDPLAPPLAEILPSKCCNAQTIARSQRVAKDLGIPLYVLDLEKEFKEEVVDPFLKGYEKGETPNPCIGCNKTMKFGRLIEFMHKMGCEKLATGHYARITREKKSDGSAEYLLLEAVDKKKDQSYYLYGLNQEQLSRVFFPLGNMKKDDVFALAEKFDIPYDPASYRESQDLCFFPEKEPQAFLKRHIRNMAAGPIKDAGGTTVGKHKGLPLYTIGQRKGLGIGGLKIPLHVDRIDARTNTLYVAPDGADRKSELFAASLHWISEIPEQGRDYEHYQARISSLGRRHHGTLRVQKGLARFRFHSPVRGIATGQSIVLYRGEEIIGGGVIAGNKNYH